jgi:hypothetical protein
MILIILGFLFVCDFDCVNEHLCCLKILVFVVFFFTLLPDCVGFVVILLENISNKWFFYSFEAFRTKYYKKHQNTITSLCCYWYIMIFCWIIWSIFSCMIMHVCTLQICRYKMIFFSISFMPPLNMFTWSIALFFKNIILYWTVCVQQTLCTFNLMHVHTIFEAQSDQCCPMLILCLPQFVSVLEPKVTSVVLCWSYVLPQFVSVLRPALACAGLITAVSRVLHGSFTEASTLV